MRPFEEIKNYSGRVCEQIRWKRAHRIISEELESHICDQRDAYMSEGADEETATMEAIRQMGDPVLVGTELDKTHRPKPQWAMICITVALVAVGIIARYALGIANGRSDLASALALILFLAVYFMDFTILGRHSGLFCAAVLVISVAGSFFVHTSVHGVKWISLGSPLLSMSMANMALIYPLTYAVVIYMLRDRGFKGILMCGAVYAFMAFILLSVPSFAGFMLFTVSAAVLLYLAAAKGWLGIGIKQGKRLILSAAAAGLLCVTVYLVQNPYFRGRFQSMIDPYSDPDGAGYLGCLIRDLIGGAAFAGKGTLPLQFGGADTVFAMPDFSTDYVLVSLTHHFGWIVFIAITAVFLVFSVLGLRYVFRQKSVLGTLVSASVMLTFIGQTLIYIFTNLGYIRVSTLSLPFISYGNSAMIIDAALVGFMLSVFRTGEVWRERRVRIKTAEKEPVLHE